MSTTSEDETQAESGESTVRRLAPWLAIALIATISGAVRIWVNQKVDAPYILTDELRYSGAAERLAATGALPPTSVSFLYPVFISPAWLVVRH